MPSSSPVRVVVMDDYEGFASQHYAGRSFAGPREASVTVYTDPADTATFVQRTDGADIVVVMRERFPLPREVLAQLSSVKLIVTTGGRNRSIDVAAANELGITVSNTGGRDTGPSEIAWALLLAVARSIPQADADVRAGRWSRRVGDTLSGRRLGIVGLGRLGASIVPYAHAFGMEVIAASQSRTAAEADRLGVELVDRDTLFRESDVVSVHLALNDATRSSIGRREFAMMKRTAIFVNAARGGLVDQDALIDALQAGQIAGAGLDVFGTEPLPADSPLCALPNVLLTPHIGYVTRRQFEEYYRSCDEIIDEYLRGNIIRDIVV